MNARLIDDASARALDVAWLWRAIAPAGAYGERCAERRAAFARGDEMAAQYAAERVARLADACDDAQIDAARAIFRRTPDAGNAIASAAMGEILGDAAFLELQRFFDGVIALDALFVDVTAFEPVANDAIHACAATLEPGRTGMGFYLDDAFGADLVPARDVLARTQAEYDAQRGRAVERVAKVLGRDTIAGDEFIVMRADFTGPLPAGVRVVREAPTYVLCELDVDESTLASLTRRDAAIAALASEEEAARARLSMVIRMHAAALDRVMNAFGERDVLIAAAGFTRAHRCVVAEMVTDAAFSFEGGRYLPIVEELARDGRSFTPVSIVLDQLAVLTGPNMGGKSVSLRTCGFIALCAAFGLPVPAEHATIPLFADIAWLGVGADDGTGGLLSSFAREVVRLRDVLACPDPQLLLFDEFARTTTPHEGKALLVAVLERLRARGMFALAATHLAGVAAAAGVRHYAVRGLRGIPDRSAARDLDEALAVLADSMDYTIVEVADEGEIASDAIALAALLGLDDDIVTAAMRNKGA